MYIILINYLICIKKIQNSGYPTMRYPTIVFFGVSCYAPLSEIDKYGYVKSYEWFYVSNMPLQEPFGLLAWTTHKPILLCAKI